MARRNRLTNKVQRLSQVNREKLREYGIFGIILDLDNTIVSEDDVYLSPYAEEWISEAQKEGMKLFILSNGKRKDRVRYWSSRLNVSAIVLPKSHFLAAFVEH